MSELPNELELSEGYDSLGDIVREVVEVSIEEQGVDENMLEEIPITVIDDEVMPDAIENGTQFSQDTWDETRDIIRNELSSRGYTISYAFS